MVQGPERGWQIHINPEIYNSVSPEAVAIKSFTADIWREGDKGAAGKSCRGPVKQKKKEISLTVDLIIRKPGRAIFLWLDADWQASRIAVLFPSCLWPAPQPAVLQAHQAP